MDLQTSSDVVLYLVVALCVAVVAYRSSRYGDQTRPGGRSLHSPDFPPPRGTLRQAGAQSRGGTTGCVTRGEDPRAGFPVVIVAVSIVLGAPLFLLLQNDPRVSASRTESRTRSTVGEPARPSAPERGARTQNYCPANYTDQGAGEDGSGMSREDR